LPVLPGLASQALLGLASSALLGLALPVPPRLALPVPLGLASSPLPGLVSFAPPGLVSSTPAALASPAPPRVEMVALLRLEPARMPGPEAPQELRAPWAPLTPRAPQTLHGILNPHDWDGHFLWLAAAACRQPWQPSLEPCPPSPGTVQPRRPTAETLRS